MSLSLLLDPIISYIADTNFLLLLFILLVPTIFLILKEKEHKHWESLGIDGPKPWPIFGNLIDTFKRPLSEIEDERFLKYGRIHGSYDLYTPLLTIGEPELIKDIMVKNFNVFPNRRFFKQTNSVMSKFLILLRDDEWKRVRAITSPTFSSGKMKRMFSLMDECVENIVLKLEEFCGKKELDVKWFFGSYTMDVIAKCAFATNTNSLNDPKNPFVLNAYKIINVPLWRQMFFLLAPKFILRMLKYTIAPPESVSFFRDVAHHVLKERKENVALKHNDFLQLLIDAERTNDLPLEEESLDNPNSPSNFKLGNNENKKLDEHEITANIMLFFIAGYETTGSLLSFCVYNLALNPKCQEKLYQELKNAGEINYDSVTKLAYLDAVISETLRLHNPITRVEREAKLNYEMTFPNGKKISLKEGDRIAIPIHAIHHDPHFFHDPYLFDPERFIGSNRDDITPYTFLPFGHGPRNCIGMRFALIEAKLALVKVLFKFRFVQSANTDIPILLTHTRPGLLQAKRIMLNVEKRF